MTPYVFPVKTAFFIFLIAAMFLLIPWLIYGYRKDGFFSWSRFAISFSFVFYMLAAYCLVILPMPETRNNCAQQAADAVYYNLIPFTFISDMFKETPMNWSQPSSYMAMIRSRAFLQALFNVFLLMPLGVYIRYFMQQRSHWKKALIAGFGLSLFFELTQITGLYGYFACPYRLFDIDDLMLNSSGAVLGFLIAPILLAMFPSRARLQAKTEQIVEQNKVFPVAQLLALMIDAAVIALLSNLFSIFNLASGSNVVTGAVNTTLAMMILLFFVPMARGGKTPGSAFMRFRYVNISTGQPSFKTLFKRWLALYIPWLILSAIRIMNEYAVIQNAYIPETYQVWISVGIYGLYMLACIVLAFHLILVLFSRGKRNFYFDEVSGTKPSRK
ncbi:MULTISPECIES: VanZ family protein [Paenibacillus]|uniref:VanZ family protein n=1 Tax=Paenibacillus TaxID=44249 RepID=UPI0030DD5563